MAVEEEGLRVFQSVKIKIGERRASPPPEDGPGCGGRGDPGGRSSRRRGPGGGGPCGAGRGSRPRRERAPVGARVRAFPGTDPQTSGSASPLSCCAQKLPSIRSFPRGVGPGLVAGW